MTLWKPKTLRVPYDHPSRVKKPSAKPEDQFPFWDRGPGVGVYDPVLIKMIDLPAGDDFTFAVFDRDGGVLTELPKRYTLNRHEKNDGVDSHFCSYPSTVDAWFENPTKDEVCLLFIEREYAVKTLGVPRTALFPEGKWPRGLGGLNPQYAALLLKLFASNPKFLSKLSKKELELFQTLWPGFPKP